MRAGAETGFRASVRAAVYGKDSASRGWGKSFCRCRGRCLSVREFIFGKIMKTACKSSRPEPAERLCRGRKRRAFRQIE